MVWLRLWAALAVGLWTSGARAQEEEKDAEPDVLPLAVELPDYTPARAWNGLGRFVELARRMGITVELVTADGVKYEPSGTLVFAFPDTAPDRTSSAFRQDPAFPIALPSERHPALDGVGAVVTNHPAALGLGPEGRCLLSFLAPPPACLLAEVERGYGTALALADPSVLIDLMLEADGNRRLASGLLRHLTANRLPRITLIVPREAWEAARPVPPEGAGARAAVRRWLAKASEVLAAAPPWLWFVAGLGLFAWAAAGRVRAPSRDDFQPPRLLHADRPESVTAYPAPAGGDAWSAFSLEAVDAMHAAVTRRREEVSARLEAERRSGGGLRRRMRLRLEGALLSRLQRRHG